MLDVESAAIQHESPIPKPGRVSQILLLPASWLQYLTRLDRVRNARQSAVQTSSRYPIHLHSKRLPPRWGHGVQPVLPRTRRGIGGGERLSSRSVQWRRWPCLSTNLLLQFGRRRPLRRCDRVDMMHVHGVNFFQSATVALDQAEIDDDRLDDTAGCEYIAVLEAYRLCDVGCEETYEEVAGPVDCGDKT